jgi:hypothetical protein
VLLSSCCRLELCDQERHIPCTRLARAPSYHVACADPALTGLCSHAAVRQSRHPRLLLCPVTAEGRQASNRDPVHTEQMHTGPPCHCEQVGERLNTQQSSWATYDPFNSDVEGRVEWSFCYKQCGTGIFCTRWLAHQQGIIWSAAQADRATCRT